MSRLKRNTSLCFIAVAALFYYESTEPSSAILDEAAPAETTATAAEHPTAEPPAAQPEGEYTPLVEAEKKYAHIFRDCGAAHGVDPALLAAIADVESDFRPKAVSAKGAQGLMQFMPRTAANMGVDPWNPESAVCGTARYIVISFGLHNGDWPETIAAYNAGDPDVKNKGKAAAEGSYVEDVQTAWANRKPGNKQ